MSRLTSEPFRRKSDDSLENYKVRRKGREEWETLAQNAINKLGKLEDLMDEYNINSIEQLENTLSSKFIAGGFRSAGKSIVAKEILYNILSEEELGCPLEVVFRAFNEGVYIEVEHLPDVIERPRLYYSVDFKCYCFELLYGEYVIKLSDYQKTWWLKGEKNESCNRTD